MAEYAETFTYGSETINVTMLSAVKKQKQRIMVVGKKLNRIDIMGANVFQWEIDINAVVYGANSTALYVNRLAIETLNDLASHAYVDGLHDGNYYMIPESLEFNDTSDRGNMSFVVKFKLVEA